MGTGPISVVHVLCFDKSSHCSVFESVHGDFSPANVTVLDYVPDTPAFNGLLGKCFYQSATSMSHETQNFQFYMKSISYEHNIAPVYSLSITAAQAEPSGDCFCSTHYISFVRL